MKIRTNFVSNSSSSSFIIIMDKDDDIIMHYKKDEVELNDREREDEEYKDLIKNGGDIDLIEIYSSTQDPYYDEYTYDTFKPFHIPKSFDEIANTDLKWFLDNCDLFEYYEDRDNDDAKVVTYEYTMKTLANLYIKYIKDIYDNEKKELERFCKNGLFKSIIEFEKHICHLEEIKYGNVVDKVLKYKDSFDKENENRMLEELYYGKLLPINTNIRHDFYIIRDFIYNELYSLITNKVFVSLNIPHDGEIADTRDYIVSRMVYDGDKRWIEKNCQIVDIL